MFVAKLAQGYMGVEEFLAFLARSGNSADALAGLSIGGAFAAAIAGGLAMNLTPCVLPMIPVNLMVIGKSAKRGALYGVGMMLAYGALGLLAALGGVAFGAIQSNPWFNVAIAAIFTLLALSLLGVFRIDLSGARTKISTRRSGGTVAQDFFALFMGAVAAVLAGACVAPILIAVLLLTARLAAQGNIIAFALPFALGLGMALPWPFAGAGMKVLPKPGAWMAKVEKAFGVVVILFALWYAYLAYGGFAGDKTLPQEQLPAGESAAVRGSVVEATPETFTKILASAQKPVLVDCWATWCKNCKAMEKRTLADEKVQEELKRFTLIRLDAEDIDELRKLAGFEQIAGLPAFLIFE